MVVANNRENRHRNNHAQERCSNRPGGGARGHMDSHQRDDEKGRERHRRGLGRTPVSHGSGFSGTKAGGTPVQRSPHRSVHAFDCLLSCGAGFLEAGVFVVSGSDEVVRLALDLPQSADSSTQRSQYEE